MKPPYDIFPQILSLISSISTKLGEVNANHFQRQSPGLRKQNRIKTIHSTLQIEGNTLSEEQITAIIESRKVIGPKKDVTEVLNAIKVYDNLTRFKPTSQKSFLEAHKLLMHGLIESPGKYRNKGVGIAHGSNVAHIAPPAKNVSYLMADLFAYLKNDKDISLIKSCVFHYEMEFIHPFLDGNGRMGRLWQIVILLQDFPVFEFLPFETLIAKNQDQYYRSLSISDKAGKSTAFIEYMLTIIDQALKDLLNFNNRILKDLDRLDYYKALGNNIFSRKDYMNTFKNLSSATASRDLLKGLEKGLLTKEGDKNQTRYRFNK
ncbi:MAG: Fic family protein [Bacteroidota bacterium]|nr:Fic family protein [Bacteroidota bacterium]